MKIENLKDLQKLIQLCRKEGVDAFELDGLKFNLGAKPKAAAKLRDVANDFPEAQLQVPQYNPGKTAAELVSDVIKTNALTEEQLLNYSVRDEMQDN